MHPSFFGTDGIRSAVGTNLLTPTNLLKLGSAIGQWATTRATVNTKPSLAIAYDTRLSASLLKVALQTGLLQHSLTVHDLGVMPTPALHYTISELKKYDVGIMITASHNQYIDNGLKIVTQQGKISKEDEQIIVDIYHTNNHTPDYENLGTTLHESSIIDHYLAALTKKLPPLFLTGITVVVDCAHGAYSPYAPQVLENLGAHVITLNAQPNGKNINNNAGSLHPDALSKTVIETKAHVGIAFDGDGDRVILVNPNGTIKDGDDLLALLSTHPTYEKQSTIVGTIMSNQGLEQHLKQLGKTLVRTPVGDKYVVQKMIEDDVLLGAEPSGHVILRDFSDTSDGLFTALRTLECIVLRENWDVETFIKYFQYTGKIPVHVKRDLLEEPLRSIIESHEQQIVKNGGRLIVRYSGTEPILRVMVEGHDAKDTEMIGCKLSEQLKATL